MNKSLKYLCLIAAFTPLLNASAPSVLQNFGSVPLSFEANQGQAPEETKYLARSNGYFLSLEHAGIRLALHGKTGDQVIGISWPSKTNLPPTGEKLLAGKSNYLIGHDADKWRKGLPNYGAVRYPSVAPGIDLLFYGKQSQLEYDVVLQPGADPNAIRFRMTGVGKLELSKSGDLLLALPAGVIVQKKPIIYQEINGRRTEVAGRYRLFRGQQVGFSLGSYDHSQPLTIDPVIAYSTYLPFFAPPTAIAVDNTGAVYMTGTTSATNLPVVAPASSSPYQSSLAGANDAFILKFNPAQNAIVYLTYLGGSGNDTPSSIAVDSLGQAYVAGDTMSATDFPIKNQIAQATTNGPDLLFVAGLNATGSDLLFSTFFSPYATVNAITLAVGPSNTVYLTGSGLPQDVPVTTGAYETNYTGTNRVVGFVSKLTSSGALVWSTFLRGTGDYSACYDVVVDSTGAAYVTGYTNDASFPTTNGAFITSASFSISGFASKFSADGSQLVFSTLITGGAGDETIPSQIAQDNSGVYLAGSVTSNVFLCKAQGRSSQRGDNDVFVLKLNASGTQMLYCLAFGGTEDELYPALAVANGQAYVAGTTESNDFPVTAFAPEVAFPGNDFGQSRAGFVSKLSSPGTGFEYSTYLGGSDSEVTGLAVDAQGSAYVTGTASSGYPVTPGAFDTSASTGPVITKIADSTCTYSLSSPSYSGTLQAAVINVQIETQSGCNWVVANSSAWITTSATYGTGSATLTLSVPANAGVARTATLSIAGNPFVVSQPNGCQYAVSPLAAIFSVFASATVTVTTDESCPWTAVSNDLSVSVSGSTFEGPGSVVLSTAFPYSNRLPSQTGTVTVAGQTVTITQEADSDLNNDGYSDLIWQDPVSGTSQIWYLGGDDGTTLTATAALTGSNPWRIVGIADIGHRGRQSLIWQDPASGVSQVWFLDGTQGTTITGTALLSGPNAWRIVAVGDVNLDGNPDVIWQDPVSGASQVWYLGGPQGVSLIGTALISNANTWRIAGAGVFDYFSRRADLVWQDPVSGASQMWIMGGPDGLSPTSIVTLSGPNSWRIAGFADINGDGYDDIIWEDPSSGMSQVWLVSNNGLTGGNGSISGPNAWRLAGRSQLLWP